VTSEPAVSLRKLGNDTQTVGINADFSLPVGVLVEERYGNTVRGKVTWTIEHGPVTFIDPPTDPFNLGDYGSSVSLRPAGTEGVALVRASLDGTTAVADFTLTVGPPQYVVRLGSTAFISVQNSTKNPAVDTVPAGQTVVWLIDYDYFQPHRVVSVGTPSFRTPPTSLSTRVTFAFTVPGTYRYGDFYNPDIQGILVVQ
jgi:plastocyanin